MIKPETLKALRVIALQNADEKTYDAWYKSICRWYSEKFHTKLTEVEDMAEEDVLRTYYEDLFWGLRTGTEKQQEAFERIVEDVLIEEGGVPEAELAQAEAEDDDWYEKELAALEKQIAKQDRRIADKIQDDGTGDGLMDEPNLDDESSVTFGGEDDVIPDEEIE